MVKFNPTEGCGEFLPGYGYPYDFTPPVSVGAPDPGDPPSPVVVYCGFQDFAKKEQIPNNPLITTRINQLGSEVTVITFPLGKTIEIPEQFLDANPAIKSSLDANPSFATNADPNFGDAYAIFVGEVSGIVSSYGINPDQIGLNLPQGLGNYGTQANICGTFIIELVPPVITPFPTVDLSGPGQEPIPPNPDGGFSAKFTVDIDPAGLPEWELVPNGQDPIVITPSGGSYEDDIEVDVNFGPVTEDTQVSVVAVGKDNEGNIEVSSNTVTVTLDYVEPEEVSITVTANPNPVAVNENTDIVVTIVSGEVNQFEIDYGDGQSATQFVDGADAYTLAKTYNTTGTKNITVDAKVGVGEDLETVKTESVNVDVSSSPNVTPLGTISSNQEGFSYEVGSEVTFIATINGQNGASYFWYLGDTLEDALTGNPDIQSNEDFDYKFMDEGTYVLVLRYVDSTQFLTLDSVTITITPKTTEPVD